MRKFLLFSLILLLGAVGLRAQVTTSSVSGSVTDDKGEALPGASVIAVHTPSGSRYATSTNLNGRYTISGMRVGGPYTITIKFIGFQDKVINNVTLSLGATATASAQLSTTSAQLSEVVVTGNRGLLDDTKTGNATNVTRETIQSIPTVNRGLRDLTKLSPVASINGSGTSFAGTNNRYNQFAIDGIVNNDVFGLASSGTNGGQTGIEPISLDAIEEFQLNIAPYDVRQGGFTGGGINAVTRSGTNKFQGSVYYFRNNENFVGRYNPNTGVKAKVAQYDDAQYGFRLGGPIIKNKLFFFINGELTENTQPNAFNPFIAGSGSNITADEVTRVAAVINRIAPNYDLGSANDVIDEVNSKKILGKLDWNINNNHKLTLRHSYTYGENIDNSRTSNQTRFYNNGQFFPSTTNSSGLELNSNFNGKFSNNLLLGYTSVRDDRDPLGNPFPQVTVNLGNSRSIVLGSEPSSVANNLKQDIFSITDNFNVYAGKHTLTFGTSNEFYKFYNLFVQNIFGAYSYNSLANFETVGTPTEVAPSFYQVGYSFATDDNPFQTKGAPEFSAMQLGLYVQDDFQVNDRLKLTVGLRGDLPIFKDRPARNNALSAAFPTLGSLGINTDQIPEKQILFSPRFGFNYDVLGDNSFKVRGGAGIFTGRVPFVWISNQYSNNGTVNGTYSIGNSSATSAPIANPAGVEFNPDPFSQPTAQTYGGTPGLGDINITARNFKFPQTFRTNIGVDKELPWFGLVGTFEAIYSKGINNINYRNLNRQVDQSFTFNGSDKRPRYIPTTATTGRISQSFNEVILLENSNEGHTYNFVFQLQKPVTRGVGGSIAYNYGRSTDLNTGSSSTAYSNWRNALNVNGPNDISASTSIYDIGHRISGYVTYRKEYFKNIGATQISLFYNGQSGAPFSYIYNGDLNQDGTSNDLIYVPKDENDIVLVPTTGTNALTASDQWKLLDAYISNDDYLSTRRGEYAERNKARTPFQHQFDFRLLQEVAIKTGSSVNRLQISLDILNFGNLLNKEWGRVYSTNFNAFSLISYNSLGPDGKTPRFQYTGGGQTNGKPYSSSDFNSRYRAQLGLRYIFN